MTRSCPNGQSDASTYSNSFRSFTRSMTRDEFRSALKRNKIELLRFVPFEEQRDAAPSANGQADSGIPNRVCFASKA
ncbi:hypothetical protein E5D57_010883 [Metarhizium anisopliae]|nr:hypothetical protein E5D57_010883 [Metarhizium anisopliae]